MEARGFDITPPKSYDLQKLRARHHAIIRMALAGHTNKQIADELEITEATVGYTLRSTLAQEKMSQMQAILDLQNVDMLARLEGAAPIAFMELFEVMTTTADERLKAKTAVDIIDRAGYSPIKRTIGVTKHIQQTDIDEIKSRIKANGGRVIDENTMEDAVVVDEKTE